VLAKGFKNSTSNFPFTGWMGEFYFYNRELTASEVEINYQATRGRFL
jgi:hypothetical protein